MKLAKLIRPLFLVALGLHGLALFVPIGPQEAAVIEDLDIVELEPETRDDLLTNRSVGPLPVPDPNVAVVPSAAGKPTAKPAVPGRAAAPTTVTRRAAPTTVAVRPAAPTARQPVSRANPSAVTPASSSSTNQSSSTQSNSPEANSRSNSTAAQTPAATPTDDEDSDESLLSSVDLPESSEQNAVPTSPASEKPITVAALLADVTQDLPTALREAVVSLEKSLTYSAADTDDASAQKNRSEWLSKIQRQANISDISSIETTESALTELNYPIESSQQSSELMQGRNINLCLNEPKPGKAEVGVLFDASGNVVDQPELLRSTGYGVVDEEIKAIAATQENFPRDRNSKAYSFEVEVKYDKDACVTLSDLKK